MADEIDDKIPLVVVVVMVMMGSITLEYNHGMKIANIIVCLPRRLTTYIGNLKTSLANNFLNCCY